MVVIRLERRGTNKTPHHRIVATERARAQGSRVLETLGYYDPSRKPPVFTLSSVHICTFVGSWNCRCTV